MSATATYGFQAVGADGALETGFVEAGSREAAVALVRSRGLFPVQVSRHHRRQLAGIRMRPDDLALGLRALATLLGSGLSISRSLSLLEDLTPPSWTPALPELRRRIEQGEHLSAALQGASVPLPPHVLGVIGAGDAGSDLAEAVDSAAQLLETRAATRAALRNALAYPLMLAVAGSLSVALLVGVVLPRFVGLLAEAGQGLPLTTRLVLGLGSMARSGAVPALAGLAAVAIAWRVWVGRPGGRRRWHDLLLRLPGVGPVRRSSGTSNTCSALAALLRAGVPLAVGLPHAARATGDSALEHRLAAARERLLRGESFARAAELEGALTPTAVRFARIGEETGGLGDMLAHAAEVEARQALQRLHRLIRLLEPTMILAFGLIVMVVAAALLQAMYGLRPSP